MGLAPSGGATGRRKRRPDKAIGIVVQDRVSCLAGGEDDGGGAMPGLSLRPGHPDRSESNQPVFESRVCV